jgi:hypothetical protein
MATFRNFLSKKIRNSLFATLTLAILFTPVYTLAAERDGTVLFFSWRDLQQKLSHPSLPELSSSFSWQDPYKQTDQESRIEQNFRWGNGLGIDSYAYPGTRQPLWGY